MKKRGFIMMGVAAIAAAGVLAGCGGNGGNNTATTAAGGSTVAPSDATAQTVAKMAYENMEKVKSYSFDGDTKMNYSMSASGVDMSMNVDMNINGEGITDTNEAHVIMDLKMDMLGQDMSTKNEAYAVKEDGKYTVYSKSEGEGMDEGWQKSEDDTTTVEFESLNNMNVYKQIADGKIEAELSEGEKINGKDVYKLTCKIPGEIFQETYSAMGQDSSSGMAGIDFSQASADCDLYIYKDSGLPARTFMDAKEYGENIFKQAMSQSGSTTDATVTVENFEVDMTMDDYDKIDKIEVPADVKNAV